MADAIALLVAAGLLVAAMTSAVVLAAYRHRAAIAGRERATAAVEADTARIEHYIDAVNAAASPADLEALARKFNDKRKS